ncbi:MAG: magnesium transporter [Deltaproteobacteria bacterium RIFCSPLOWO2_01_44_7]|nr:MAG: magnesium transporter [Deltaproteobacteria bacterium RIFCSPHIGHO2_01_FULL_43_49]OGQ15901.1 MAG: magnesium transporter [Deltaproteobacteria bacterium RIFCSPHIGHO2_02_FULL_44_53]OGQ28864.1 MAG: magnesium transporter [Deltaproteobacteria bacterium RIFCSPHIGHO2_12_FULL_44_21]OGQ30956.1 MAG: magnesium transporter [Deltaproteobacteria bacterium RIFCSPLOWO2_01_FULL_45_74]OGQ38840.1 MAG: magnesium transporter [Deltaproteobacteria bacterium RIFCSPLOWO2_01_44_7]OGQ43462.1 MAG: magnesium transpor
MHFSKRVEFIRRLVQAGAKQKLVHALEKLGTLQSARILRQLRAYDQKLFLEVLLAHPLLDQILLDLSYEALPEVLAHLSNEQLITILSRMPSDWDWSFLEQLPQEKQQSLLEQLPTTQREKIAKISQYPKESCGEIMHPEAMSVKASALVEEAIQTIRQADPQLKVFYLYVVDEEGHLLGTVPLRSLIRENPETLVSQVMLGNPIAVRALDARTKAAQMVAQNKLLAVPVVDEAHHLLGVITVDDVIDIVEEQATEEMYHMAGLSKDDRIFAPWWRTARKRLVWMSLNLVTAFLAASVVGLFQQSISKVVALAIFMPVVAGMGGNGGTQSLTVMTRALALGEIGGREVWRVLTKEVLVGLTVGAITGLATGLIAWHWQGNFYLGFVLWLAMMTNMMIAGFAGSMIPMTLRTLKLDPALGSGVLVTTFTDVFGFLTFLGLATLFLKYLV